MEEGEEAMGKVVRGANLGRENGYILDFLPINSCQVHSQQYDSQMLTLSSFHQEAYKEPEHSITLVLAKLVLLCTFIGHRGELALQ